MSPERWLELTVGSSLDPELVSEILLDLGGTAVQESGGALVTYLVPPPDLEALLAMARQRLQDLSPSSHPEVTWRWQPQKDWERLWRQGLGPRVITPRLVVAPSWEEVAPEEGVLLITLDPGMAFGTAEHATTRGCLRILDSRVSEGDRIADVGAGSGILSIAAALMGADEILAIEMDEMSCETALENVEKNGVADRVTILQARVEGTKPLTGSPFDGIVANLQSHLLLPLLPVFRKSLGPESWLALSGILAEERDEVLTAATRQGFVFLDDDAEEGWWTGVFRPDQPLP